MTMEQNSNIVIYATSTVDENTTSLPSATTIADGKFVIHQIRFQTHSNWRRIKPTSESKHNDFQNEAYYCQYLRKTDFPEQLFLLFIWS